MCYYSTYLVNASKVWLLSIVDINLSISGKKAPFSCTKLTMRIVGANIGCVLVLLVHGKVVVDFGRKVFFVDCLL